MGHCSSLTMLKLGKFNISGFTNGTNYNLFDNDTSLKDIYITSDSPSLSFLESQCILSKIASNVTIAAIRDAVAIPLTPIPSFAAKI